MTILIDLGAVRIETAAFESIIASASGSRAPNVVNRAVDLWHALGCSAAYSPQLQRTIDVRRVPVFQRTVTLYDEPGTREKATVMDKWLRSTLRTPDFEGVDEFLEWGESYRITIEKV
jgi:hypothetical protein